MASSDALRVLAALHDAGHITAEQKRRVERSLASGRELMEALRDTPLVEPMIFYRVAHGAGLTTTPSSEPFRDEPTPTHIEGVRRDSRDAINILELELDDDPPPKLAAPLPSPKKPAAKPASPQPAAQPDRAAPCPEAASFIPVAGKVPEFDLRNDEGINAVRVVNEAIAPSAFEGASLRLVLASGGNTLTRYGVTGANVAKESLDAERADLFATRLRVMARIQPRATGSHRRAFHARIDGRALTALVESAVESDKTGTVAVWFVARVGG